MKIKDSTIIITGGASGLGRNITDYLLNQNAKVAVIDKSVVNLDNIPDHENLLKLECDITIEDEIKNAFIKINNKWDKVNVLINNAGILYSELLVNVFNDQKRHSLAGWRKVIDLNLTSSFIMASFAAEHMILNRIKGVIINISSVCAAGNAGQSAYSAAKAGLNALTKVWAKELGSMGIRVVSVSPGYINTESTKNAVNTEYLQEIKNETALKRLGSVNDVTSAVIFCIENEYITSTIISVDGGIVI